MRRSFPLRSGNSLDTRAGLSGRPNLRRKAGVRSRSARGARVGRDVCGGVRITRLLLSRETNRIQCIASAANLCDAGGPNGSLCTRAHSTEILIPAAEAARNQRVMNVAVLSTVKRMETFEAAGRDVVARVVNDGDHRYALSGARGIVCAVSRFVDPRARRGLPIRSHCTAQTSRLACRTRSTDSQSVSQKRHARTGGRRLVGGFR